MTREQFYTQFQSPLVGAILKKWPNGNIMQYWAESPSLYSGIFGKIDDFGRFLCGHSGIDIVTFEGDDVRAAHDGTIYEVIKDNLNNLGGNYVAIRSPHYLTDKGNIEFCITSYGHLREVVVQEGQQIFRGEKIGTEGNSGFVISGSTVYWGNAPAGKGVHLHFGIIEFKIENGVSSYLYPNCLGNTSDPLPIIMYKNPNYSGTQILLANMVSLLRYWLNKLA